MKISDDRIGFFLFGLLVGATVQTVIIIFDAWIWG
jgi:hypothetical protein